MGKTSVSPALKALCAELLRYGGAAQSYKNYRTDTPAHGNMTEEALSLLQNPEDVLLGDHNRELPHMEAPVIKWHGKALSLESKVAVCFVVNTGDFTGDPQDLTLKVRYTDSEGVEQTEILAAPEAYGNKEHLYAFYFQSLNAAELRSVLYSQVYLGETPLSNTLEYSVDTYGNGKTGSLAHLCKALLSYSDSAKAYFMSIQ